MTQLTWEDAKKIVEFMINKASEMCESSEDSDDYILRASNKTMLISYESVYKVMLELEDKVKNGKL